MVQNLILLSSLERVYQYLQIEHEPKPSEEGKPPAYWPASGNIRVENLCARYSDGENEKDEVRCSVFTFKADSPEVLSNVSFEIQSGERVGVGES